MIDDTTHSEPPGANGAPKRGGGEEEAAAACLVIIGGAQVGELYRLAGAANVIGRGRDADVRLLDDGVSRRHAQLRIAGGAVSIEDLDSANGTFCNGVRIRGSVNLHDGDKISMGTTTILKFMFQDDLDERYHRRLYESAVKDGLTGLHNRRHFDERLRVEMTFSKRHHAPLALLLVDIDHFKRINDGRGHPAGDRALKEVAKCLVSAVRAEDEVARYGGEEFAILCRQTNAEDALALAERVRAQVAGRTLSVDGPPLRATVSVGIAVAPWAGLADGGELVQAADTALYEAKRRGRDCSVVFQEP